MRVVGYARESVDAEQARPVFAQQEEIRRWAAQQGHQLVALCQDRSGDGHHPLDRHGYLAVLGAVASGGADAVVVPGIATLSDDQIVQEILLWDLQARGVSVLSTDAEDAAVLGGEDPGATRMLIRDVLARIQEHAATLSRHPQGRARPTGGVDVVVELLAALPDPGETDPTAVNG
ncbi:MAG: recombinase family protein [Actinobacteria bacterium]|nr:recombinase family protein [Actinomycetota bacterium]MBU1494563.1 recombinase family protein [Actinomycetota bacterium]MBU1864854.1 recombinase family protein [Actinomycetota bacterium]